MCFDSKGRLFLSHVLPGKMRANAITAILNTRYGESRAKAADKKAEAKAKEAEEKRQQAKAEKDAEKKAQLEQEAKEAADAARKTGVGVALWSFISLLVGAFSASYMATVGGPQRDEATLFE